MTPVKLKDLRLVRVGDKITFLDPAEDDSFYCVRRVEEDGIYGDLLAPDAPTAEDILIVKIRHWDGGPFWMLNRDPRPTRFEFGQPGYLGALKPLPTIDRDPPLPKFEVGQRFLDEDGDICEVEAIDLAANTVTMRYPGLDEGRGITMNWPLQDNPNRPGYLGSLKPLPTITKKENMTITDANRAKLELAAEHALQAKFSYTNQSGETHDVRLFPEDLWASTSSGTVYVSGETDEDDYKQYRLDRINGKVVIR